MKINIIFFLIFTWFFLGCTNHSKEDNNYTICPKCSTKYSSETCPHCKEKDTPKTEGVQRKQLPNGGELFFSNKSSIHIISSILPLISRKKNLYNIEIIYKEKESLYLYFELGSGIPSIEFQEAQNYLEKDQRLKVAQLIKASLSLSYQGKQWIENQHLSIDSMGIMQVRAKYAGDDVEELWKMFSKNPEQLLAKMDLEYQVEGENILIKREWNLLKKVQDIQNYMTIAK